MPALPRINFFDSRRKGSISYVLAGRLAPVLSRRLEAGQPGFSTLVFPGSAGSLLHFAEDWWIMTLTTEIQVNYRQHGGAGQGGGRRMSGTGGKDLEQLSIGEMFELLEGLIRELRRRASISPTIRRRASTGTTAARVRR
jgi:hypothetical protein